MAESLEMITRQQYEQLVQLGSMVQQFGSIIIALDQRIATLEKALAQKTTLTHDQVKMLNAQIGARAQEQCTKYGLDYKKAGSRIRSAIRKETLRQCGVKDLHDVKSSYYDTASGYIRSWASYKVIMSIRSNEE
ncbi:MAG: ORF6C domain-containing protein [Clostridia bacterium]|nr:ORF6C domain-containing protein [Clostridia bacterium]